VVDAKTAALLKAQFPELPIYPEGKISLAWILDHVLHLKGFTQGHVRLYEVQPLVLVTVKGATARDVETLANEVVKKVHEATGITIEREVETLAAR
jgi:UDP-N-acetylenolpyruvoylglucosamine reductase